MFLGLTLTFGNGAEVFGDEHVECGDPLEVDGVIVVIRAVGPGGKQRHGQVEEASVGGGVGHVGREVHRARVQLGVGRHVRDGGEVVVHQAGVVGLVGVGPLEPGLEDEGEEEGPGERHVVYVEHVRPVGQHRVDVNLFDVGFVGHSVLGHVQLANMLQWEQC